MKYEAVIGLEIHVQVKTRTKMFTAAPAGFLSHAKPQRRKVGLVQCINDLCSFFSRLDLQNVSNFCHIRSDQKPLRLCAFA